MCECRCSTHAPRPLNNLLTDLDVPTHRHTHRYTHRYTPRYTHRYTKATDRCVELLLADPRVDPNVEDANGISALIVAANCGTDGVIDLLMNDSR